MLTIILLKLSGSRRYVQVRPIIVACVVGQTNRVLIRAANAPNEDFIVRRVVLMLIFAPAGAQYQVRPIIRLSWEILMIKSPRQIKPWLGLTRIRHEFVNLVFLSTVLYEV